MINYLVKTRNLIKIFADFYYVKQKEEINSKNFKNEHTLVELVSKLLEMMDIGEWYFGLHSALRLHGIFLKDNAAECLICTKIPFNRSKIEVLGKKLQVFVFKPNLFDFFELKNGIRYSAIEKTFLDFMYLWRLNHVPDHKIFRILGKYREKISQEKIMNYSTIFSPEIQQIIAEFFN